MKMSQTQFGFDWGPVSVSRRSSDDKKGWVVLRLKTPRTVVQVYVTKTGKVRIYLLDLRVGAWTGKQGVAGAEGGQAMNKPKPVTMADVRKARIVSAGFDVPAGEMVRYLDEIERLTKALKAIRKLTKETLDTAEGEDAALWALEKIEKITEDTP